MTRRTLLPILLLFALGQVVTAETIAVAVFPVGGREGVGMLVDAVEQGAMDVLFDRGHVVFNVIPDHEDDAYVRHVADDARDGGARIAIILDVWFVTVGNSGPVLEGARVTVLDVIDGRTLLEESLPTPARSDRATAVVIAEQVGADAAVRAMELVSTGDSTW